MSFKKGDKVKLLRDIYRYDGPEEEVPRMLECHYVSTDFQERYLIQFGTSLKKTRILYAKEGDTGIILEIFKPENRSINYVKVITDNKCKTFRLTSIEKI